MKFSIKKMENDLKHLPFTDTDYAGDLDDRRSTFGFIFMLRTGVVSWPSKKQLVVALSTKEAEYLVCLAREDIGETWN